MNELLASGFAIAPLENGVELPAGYTILVSGETFVAFAPSGGSGLKRSAFMASIESALAWVNHQAFVASGMYPGVGELWDFADRTAIIFGNTISEHNTVWVMDWNSGLSGHARIDLLEPRDDRKSLSEDAILSRVTLWANQGNADAMWWLGWWFEASNHPKSIWYHIAAIRADPAGFGWAKDRVLDDARNPCMGSDIPLPDLGFLSAIPELNGSPFGDNWLDAVVQAEQAVHLPVDSTDTTHRKIFASPRTVSGGG